MNELATEAAGGAPIALAEVAARKIVVIGQGYVGLPVAMRAVAAGFDVVGYDASSERVKSLQAGMSYVGDISDEELLGSVLEAGSGLKVGEFYLGHSPNRIDPGNVTYNLVKTPKGLSGADAASLVVVT